MEYPFEVLHVLENDYILTDPYNDLFGHLNSPTSHLFEDDHDELRGNQYSESLEPIVSKEPVDWSNKTFCLHKTEITEEGKTIAFERQGEGTAEQIKVHFPPYCVLGTRSIGIRVQNYVRLDKGREMMTPLVYIAQPTDTSFLRKVRVTLPLKNVSSDNKIANSVEGRNIDVNRKKEICIVEAFNFSPVGAVLDKRAKAIYALTLSSDELSRLFEDSSNYLLVEQKEKQPNDETYRLWIGHRPINNWQEHAHFLARRNCFLRNMTNVGMVNTDAALKIKIPSRIQLTSGESVLTHLLSGPIDVEKRYKFNTEGSLEMELDTQNESFVFRLLPKVDLDGDVQTRCTKPVISEFLKKLGENWLECLTKVLKIPQKYFFEFIWEDIRDAVSALPVPASQGQSEKVRGLYESYIDGPRNLKDAKRCIMWNVFGIAKSGELEDANREILAEIMTHKNDLEECLREMKKCLLELDQHALYGLLSESLWMVLFPELDGQEPMQE